MDVLVIDDDVVRDITLTLGINAALKRWSARAIPEGTR